MMRPIRTLLVTSLAIFPLISDLQAQAKSGKPPSDPILNREEIQLLINGVVETWKLVWAEKPERICGPEEGAFIGCGCTGVAYGEAGRLSLVRIRKNREVERLDVSKLFEGSGLPSGENLGSGPVAVLPHWEVRPTDLNQWDMTDFAEMVHNRPKVDVMRIGDYNRDGLAAEFFLQTDYAACGKKIGVVAGLIPAGQAAAKSSAPGKLQALTSAAHPERPLKMDYVAWYALLEAKAPVRVTTLACREHGSEEQTEVEVFADQAGIHAKQFVYECGETGRGALISSSDL
jgi:hypothetical protein